MRLVIQRVSAASVRAAGEIVASIGPGLLVLVGVGREDTLETARTMAGKVSRLRIFPDGEGKMNRSVTEMGGSVLVVSQFTLCADTRKGNRPSFAAAAPPEAAQPIVEAFAGEIRSLGIEAREGRFKAHMDVSLVNDGPVTVIVDG